MMPKKPANLLNELESISDLLHNSEDNIPILQESIDDGDPSKATVDIEQVRANSKVQAKIKNRHTINPKEQKQANPSSRKKGMGDNPFLPQHIRTRLKEGKESFMKEQLSQPGNPYEPIIDELVAHYLPRIEEDLRNRLKIMATSFATMSYGDDIDDT